MRLLAVRRLDCLQHYSICNSKHICSCDLARHVLPGLISTARDEATMRIRIHGDRLLWGF